MAEIDADDVILWLVPYLSGHRPNNLDILKAMETENQSRLAEAPETKRPVTLRDDESMSGSESAFGGGEGYVFLFSHGARTSAGIVGGTANNADFILPVETGGSKYHFAITFNSRNEPIVKDLGSTVGTKVTYDDEKGQRVSNFEWPLLGPSIANGKPPVLHVGREVVFKVILPERDYATPEHTERVKAFGKGTAHAGDAEKLLSALAIQSAVATKLPTEQQTPAATAVRRFFKRRLGEGAFGEVTYRFWFETGRETAVKTPRKDSNFRLAAWKSEAKMLKRISHRHIVEFLGDTFPPDSLLPELEFEYAREGSLNKYTDLSTFESTQVLHQLSSALDYLHRRTPPIGHRDIKPENILVFHRKARDGILVKFADFGLSKAAADLQTCCGTKGWSAPEICAKWDGQAGSATETYTVAVDIWALGAVVGWAACGEPAHRPEDNYVTAALNLRKYYMRKGLAAGSSDLLRSDLLRIVCSMMLVVDPAGRSSAQQVEMAAYALLQRVEGNPAAHARIVALPGGDDSSNDDAPDSGTWKTPPGSGTWDWDSKEQRVRWFAKATEVGQATVRQGGATAILNAPTKDAADDPPYEDRTFHLTGAGHKRSLPESLSAPRSQPLGPKRTRMDGPSREIVAEAGDQVGPGRDFKALEWDSEALEREFEALELDLEAWGRMSTSSGGNPRP